MKKSTVIQWINEILESKCGEMATEIDQLKQRTKDQEKEIIHLKSLIAVLDRTGDKIEIKMIETEAEIAKQKEAIDNLSKTESWKNTSTKISSDEKREGSSGTSLGKEWKTAQKKKGGAPTEKKKNGTVIIGDSRIKYLDSALSGRDVWTASFPGATIQDITDRVEEVARGCERIITHVGVNNINPHHTSEETQKEYNVLVDSLAKHPAEAIVTGILPKRGAGGQWLSRAISANERVSVLCRERGVKFVDFWEMFWGRDDLYAIDGVHLSRKGVSVLKALYEEVLQGNF